MFTLVLTLYLGIREVLSRLMESSHVVAIVVAMQNYLPNKFNTGSWKNHLNDHPNYSADVKCPNRLSGYF